MLLNFCAECSPYLLHHRLRGQTLVSGGTLLNAVNSSRSNLMGPFMNNIFVMQDIYFRKSLLLASSSASTSVKVEFAAGSTELIFLKSESDEIILGGRVTNVSSEFSLKDVIVARKMKIDHIGFYSFMNSHGYDYSCAYCSVETVELGESNSEAVQGGECLLFYNENFDVIIDGVFQAMVFALLSKGGLLSVTMLVPFFIGRVKFNNRGSCFAANKESYSASFDICHQSSTGNCIVFDSSKNVVFAAENVLFLPFHPTIAVPKRVSMESDVQCKKVKIGIQSTSCRLPPNIRSSEQLWEFLLRQRVADQRIPSARISSRNLLIKENVVEGANFLTEDIGQFDAAFFGISKMEAKTIDPQQRLLLECVYECMENAGLRQLENAGFFIGFMGSEYADLEEANQNNALVMLGSSSSIVSGRLSHFFGSNGPSITIDTACSSSLVALDLAIQSMNAGRCERAIVAGVNLIISERGLRQRANGKMLSFDGACRTFDADANGYGRADGCVAVLLEKIPDGQEFLFEAKIEAINVNHDGRSSLLTAPNPEAQYQLISKCIRDSKVLVQDIAFWECHGTGTQLGDPIEYSALQKCFPAGSEVFVSSVKASLGHSEAASGLLGVLKAVKQLQQRYLPALPRFQNLNSQIREKSLGVLKIPVVGEKLKGSGDQLFGGVTSCGISGTNACLLLSCPKREERSREEECLNSWNTWAKLLTVSGKSYYSLEKNTKNYLEFVEQRQGEKVKNISCICAAAALNRNHFKHRNAILFVNGEGVVLGKGEVKDFGRVEFVVDTWPEFNIDLFLKVPEYLTQFKTVAGVVGLDLNELFKMEENGEELRLLDSYSKFKMLMEFGICATEIPIGEGHENGYQSYLEAMLLVDKGGEGSEKIKLLFQQALLAYVDNPDQSQPCIKANNSTVTIGPKGTFNLNSIDALINTIANAYISGVSINWEKVFAVSEHLHLSLVKLPTYAYDRQTYWITERGDQFDHPLIGNVIEHTESEVTFENLLSTRRLSFLNNVCYKGKSILSFGIITEMIVAAGFHHFSDVNTQGICIENMFLEDICFVEEDTWIKVKARKLSDELMVELIANQSTTPFCRATVRSIDKFETKKIEPPKPQQKIDPKQFHSLIFNSTGVEYKDSEIDVELDSGCNVSRISMKQTILDQQNTYFIHPLLYGYLAMQTTTKSFIAQVINNH